MIERDADIYVLLLYDGDSSSWNSTSTTTVIVAWNTWRVMKKFQSLMLYQYQQALKLFRCGLMNSPVFPPWISPQIGSLRRWSVVIELSVVVVVIGSRIAPKML